MKSGLFVICCLLFAGSVKAQSVTGYWYGSANVRTGSSANNYLLELVLNPEGSAVKGVLNYYFKNSFRSLEVKGDYQPGSRLLQLYQVPMIYYGSISNFEVDCMMDLQATLRVAQAGSTLSGVFRAGPDYKYSCPDIQFTLHLDGDAGGRDSVLYAIRNFKETYQVWTPALSDTLVAVNVIPRKVVNYPIQQEFTQRKTEIVNEIEVESDSVQVDVYDNGEVDGDIISLFYNQQLIVFNQKLTHKSIKVKLTLDGNRDYNEIGMFAENLGLIPPNTALMVISDGKNRHEVRLSSSYEKNATLRLKRKKPAP